MSKEVAQAGGRIFQSALSTVGICVWLAAEGALFIYYLLLDRSVALALVHLIGVVGILIAIYFRYLQHCFRLQAMSAVPAPALSTLPVKELYEADPNVAPASGVEETEDESDILELPPIEMVDEDESPACSLNEASSRDRVAAAFIEKLQSIVAYDTCSITLDLPETGGYLVTHAVGEHASYLKGRPVTLGEGVTGWAIANNRSFCNTDPKLDLPLTLAQHFNAYRALAVFPIAEGEHVCGAVSLYSYKLVAYSVEQQKAMREALAHFAGELSGASIDILEEQETETCLHLDAKGEGEVATVLDQPSIPRDVSLPDSAMIRLTQHHNYLPLAPAIKLAQEDSLPATKL